METRTQQPFLIPNALPFIQPTERIGKQRVRGCIVEGASHDETERSRNAFLFDDSTHRNPSPLFRNKRAPTFAHESRERQVEEKLSCQPQIYSSRKKKKKGKQDSSISNFQFVSSYPQYFSLPRSLINRDSWPLPSKGWRIYSICSEMEQEHRGNHRRIAWIDPVN